MRNMIHRIDAQGFYIDSYTLDYPYFQEDWTLTEVPLTGSFIKRKLVDNVWVEGATPEEITQTKTNELLNELVEICIYLTDRALISSVNKEGGEKYLQGQVPRYKEKYFVAKQYLLDGSISNQEWYDAIVSEMNNTNAVFGYGLTIPVFMGIIVEQYDLGQLRSKKFETKIEVFRCKTKDLIIASEFIRARVSLDLAKSIPMQLSLEDLELFSNQLDAI